MGEQLHRYYTREEEFLDEFANCASVAAALLSGDWTPSYSCNDAVRKDRQYFLSLGDLNHLVFDGAAVYHDSTGFSSVQIVLKSSRRTVNVRVRWKDGDLAAEKILDRLDDRKQS